MLDELGPSTGISSGLGDGGDTNIVDVELGVGEETVLVVMFLALSLSSCFRSSVNPGGPDTYSA